jgi:hypothetical protein
MCEEIRSYLERLRKELATSDPAVVQDALADAEDHLRAAIARARNDDRNASEGGIWQRVVEQYGSPVEVAEGYRQFESMVTPGIAPPEEREDHGFIARFLGVVRDPRAYAALLYTILALPLGVAYFAWTLTGICLGLGLLVLIIGLPFIGVFLLSIHGLAVVEGRVVEGLLGVRMPRRVVFSKRHLGWWGQLKAWLADKKTWTTLAYFLAMIVLGNVYFCVMIIMISLSLGLIAAPFLELFIRAGLVDANTILTWFPIWALWISIPSGLLDWILTLHLARLIGRFHGRVAKNLLVSA